MKRLVYILVWGLLTASMGCKQSDEFVIIIQNNNTDYDTLYIQEIITGRTIAKVSLDDKSKLEYRFPINEVIVGELTLRGTETTFLTILRPNITKRVSIDSVLAKTNNSIPDSLVNYLWNSTNETHLKHYTEIFEQGNPDTVRAIFERLIQTRSNELRKYKSKLTEEEIGILDYQNQARAYSFLMYYGRIIKGYPPKDHFYSFVDNIDNKNTYSKSLPSNLLYKYEIQYLRKNDSIQTIESFLKFIEQQTGVQDLMDFLKAYYLKEVIEHPSYWRRHEKLFNTNSISEALENESKNKYSYLIESATRSFYMSQKGVKGFDFIADKIDGSKLKLSDLKGKIIIIDTWATWCGPCVEQRPKMLEIAKKYKDNPKVAILMISVDLSVDKWKKYVRRTNEGNYGIELHIPDGMNTDFGDKYLIKSIPKYILVDSEGIIINSNLIEPSIGMEQLIERESEKL